MNANDQRACAWGGLIFSALFGIGLAVAGWLPLPSPSMTVEEVVAMYQGNTLGIRFGMFIMLAAAPFYFAFTGVMSHQLLRIPGASRAPAYLQIIAGTANAITFFLAPALFALAAFRPERDPQVLYALNDLGWFIFITPGTAATFQQLAVALGVFRDRGAQPVFPRWFGFLSVWTSLLYLTGGIAFFFKSGPFAWNGLITFYIAATGFFCWIVTAVILLMKAAAREELASTTLAAH